MKRILSITCMLCFLVLSSMFVFTACATTKTQSNTASVNMYQDFNGDVYASFHLQNVPAHTFVEYKTSVHATWQKAQENCLLATVAELEEQQTVTITYRVASYTVGKTTYTQSAEQTQSYSLRNKNTNATTFAQNGILFLHIENVANDIPDGIAVGFTSSGTAQLVAQVLQQQDAIPQYVAMVQDNGKLFIKQLHYNAQEQTFTFLPLNYTNQTTCIVAQLPPNQTQLSWKNLHKLEITAEGISLSNFTAQNGAYTLYFVLPATEQAYACISNAFTFTYNM